MRTLPIVLFSAIFFCAVALYPPYAAQAASSSKKPVQCTRIIILDGLSTEDKSGGDLIGAYADGKWISPVDFQPIVMNKKKFPAGKCPHQDELAWVTTPLVSAGELISYYGTDGKQAASGRTDAEAAYFCEDKPRERHSSFSLSIKAWEGGERRNAQNQLFFGLAPGSVVDFLKTTRTMDGPNVTFSAETGTKIPAVQITYLGQKKDAYTYTYTAELMVNGKKTVFPDAPLRNKPEEILGFFIDINADGILEFIRREDGAYKNLAVFTIEETTVTKVLARERGIDE